MPLDYVALSRQVDGLRDAFAAALSRRTDHLAEALRVYRAPDSPPDWFSPRIRRARSEWRIGRPIEPPAQTFPAGPIPADFVVVATDGSHIEADRHYGLECHLINIGLVTLRYGAYASGRLDVVSRILFGDELYLADPKNPADRQKLEGQLLGTRRSILELQEARDLAAAAPPDLPALALQDGTLTLWNLLGSQHRRFVSDALLDQEFLPALESFRELQRTRPLMVAGYISQSGSAEVVNLLRLRICDKQPEIDCAAHCRLPHPHPDRTCDAVDGVLDRDLFAEILDYGERSAVFQLESPEVREQYGNHATCFFYLHVGAEIARIEIPAWLARRSDRVRLVHQLVLDQVERGFGYPAALIEAHERAIVRAADREEFGQLIERELMAARLRLPNSEKYVSKRLRAL